MEDKGLGGRVPSDGEATEERAQPAVTVFGINSSREENHRVRYKSTREDVYRQLCQR